MSLTELNALFGQLVAARCAAQSLSSADGKDDSYRVDGNGDRAKGWAEDAAAASPAASPAAAASEKSASIKKAGAFDVPRAPAGAPLKSSLLWNANADGSVAKWLQAYDAQRLAEYELDKALKEYKKQVAAAKKAARLTAAAGGDDDSGADSFSSDESADEGSGGGGRGRSNSKGSSKGGNGGNKKGSSSKGNARKGSSSAAAAAAENKDKGPPAALFPRYEQTLDDPDGAKIKASQLPINLDALREHLFREGRLAKADLMKLVKNATEIFARETTLLEVAAPVTVCGDVHGQYYDLMKLFEVGGDPFTGRYLFLGDYVDRGSFSVECVLLLYAHKICFPHTFFMLRGNHECRHLTSYFTFKSECETKYDREVYDAIMDSFDALPLAAVVNQQFLCVHGGLSPEIDTLEDIAVINRFCEPPQRGPMCDLMWSDPMEDGDFESERSPPFIENDSRGCSYMYSHRAVCDFLDRNDLLSVIRAHEAQDHGYRMHARSASTGFPSVITLFSAPNYLDAYGNKGAVLRYDAAVMNIRQFNHSPHPYWLPNFLNVFSWSLPFCADKVNDILLTMLRLCDDDVETEREQRMSRIKQKVFAYARMMRMYKTLVDERDTLMKIKAFTPDDKIPKGLLIGGADAIEKALGDFTQAKKFDKMNEKRPDIAVDGVTERRAAFAERNKRLEKLSSSQEFAADVLAHAREAHARLERAQKMLGGATTPVPDVEDLSAGEEDIDDDDGGMDV